MIKNVVYRCIGTDFTNGILTCGYMTKKDSSQSKIDFKIKYYSCFFVLSGNGFYHKDDGRKIPIRPGDFVQRIPHERHSTLVQTIGPHSPNS